MTEFASITLENEMDLILAYKKSIRTAEILGLAISTQTAFATAVSEVCREVIDKALNGTASIGLSIEEDRFFLTSEISCDVDEDFRTKNDGFEYARKLVPVLDINLSNKKLKLKLKLSIPRSARIDQKKVLGAKKAMQEEGPSSAYEEVKLKNAELHQIRLQNELDLVHANYLNEQKNEFLSVASHELNSPLTILRSLTQLALRVAGGQDNDGLNRYLKKIDVQSAKLVTLIQQLMDVSKMEHGQISYNREVTDITDFLNDTLESLKLLIPYHNLATAYNANGKIIIDRLRIEQVLNNLIVNAAKYSDAGSKIHISTAVTDSLLTITIQDEGIGMSPETISSIFNKFYRSENVIKRYSGLGMGLYIAYRIVGDHQGTMYVESTEGKGSIFSFTLPLYTEEELV
jgi:signal transduction histidine kinase